MIVGDTGRTELLFPGGNVPLNLSMCQGPGEDIKQKIYQFKFLKSFKHLLTFHEAVIYSFENSYQAVLVLHKWPERGGFRAALRCFKTAAGVARAELYCLSSE